MEINAELIRELYAGMTQLNGSTGDSIPADVREELKTLHQNALIAVLKAVEEAAGKDQRNSQPMQRRSPAV